MYSNAAPTLVMMYTSYSCTGGWVGSAGLAYVTSQTVFSSQLSDRTSHCPSSALGGGICALLSPSGVNWMMSPRRVPTATCLPLTLQHAAVASSSDGNVMATERASMLTRLRFVIESTTTIGDVGAGFGRRSRMGEGAGGKMTMGAALHLSFRVSSSTDLVDQVRLTTPSTRLLSRQTPTVPSRMPARTILSPIANRTKSTWTGVGTCSVGARSGVVCGSDAARSARMAGRA